MFIFILPAGRLGLIIPERALTPLKQVLRKPVLSLADGGGGGGGSSALLSPAALPAAVVAINIAGLVCSFLNEVTYGSEYRRPHAHVLEHVESPGTLGPPFIGGEAWKGDGCGQILRPFVSS